MKGFYDSIDIALSTDDSVNMAMENVNNLLEIQDDIDIEKVLKECGICVEDYDDDLDDDIDENAATSVDPLDMEADEIIQMKNRYGDDCDDTYGELIDKVIDQSDDEITIDDEEEDE